MSDVFPLEPNPQVPDIREVLSANSLQALRPEQIMAPFYTRLDAPHPDDIANLQDLYGCPEPPPIECGTQSLVHAPGGDWVLETWPSDRHWAQLVVKPQSLLALPRARREYTTHRALQLELGFIFPSPPTPPRQLVLARRKPFTPLKPKLYVISDDQVARLGWFAYSTYYEQEIQAIPPADFRRPSYYAFDDAQPVSEHWLSGFMQRQNVDIRQEQAELWCNPLGSL